MTWGPDADPSQDQWTAVAQAVAGWTTITQVTIGYKASYDGDQTWSSYIPMDGLAEGGNGTFSDYVKGWDLEVGWAAQLGNGVALRRVINLHIHRSQNSNPNNTTDVDYDAESGAHNFPK